MSIVVHVGLEATAQDLLQSCGLLPPDEPTPVRLKLFVEQADRVLDHARGAVDAGRMSPEAASDFQRLLAEVCDVVMFHPIVASNRYLERFSHGVSFQQARFELQQFSVFAHQFDVAQCKLVANAPTFESYRERLKVLLNEKGIPYKHGFDGELSGRWSMKTVHFTWLRNMAAGLNLGFADVGKTWLALPGTAAFVDSVFKYYASVDQNTALGASFGIENWAANNLWKPWIAGMQKLNAELDRPVNLGYLTYHDSEEEHHSQATLDELWENFRQPWFDPQRFLDGAHAILTSGVQVYYESQLAHLPEKDGSWPDRAFEPRRIPFS